MTYNSFYGLVVNNDYSSFIFNELKTIMHDFSDDGLTSDFMTTSLQLGERQSRNYIEFICKKKLNLCNF
jgi:hypothetical protein